MRDPNLVKFPGYKALLKYLGEGNPIFEYMEACPFGGFGEGEITATYMVGRKKYIDFNQIDLEFRKLLRLSGDMYEALHLAERTMAAPECDNVQKLLKRYEDMRPA